MVGNLASKINEKYAYADDADGEESLDDATISKKNSRASESRRPGYGRRRPTKDTIVPDRPFD